VQDLLRSGELQHVVVLYISSHAHPGSMCAHHLLAHPSMRNLNPSHLQSVLVTYGSNMILYILYRDYAATIRKKEAGGDVRYVCGTYVCLRLTCLYNTVPLKHQPSGKLKMSSDHRLNLIACQCKSRILYTRITGIQECPICCDVSVIKLHYHQSHQLTSQCLVLSKSFRTYQLVPLQGR